MTFKIIASTESRLPLIVQFLINVATGRSLAVGEVTLRPSQTTTIVEAQWLSPGDTIMLQPMTANAAAALATTYIDPPVRGLSGAKASFTIRHASAVSTDRKFRWHSAGG